MLKGLRGDCVLAKIRLHTATGSGITSSPTLIRLCVPVLGKASEKKYGIFWEFFPKGGPPPPTPPFWEFQPFFADFFFVKLEIFG